MLNPFKKSYSSQEISLFRFLNKIKLFENLAYEELSEFVPHMYLRSYKVNEVVFFREDPSHALYIVKNGKVSLNVDVGEQFQSLTSVKSGETFGENALIQDTKRIYTSIVTSDSADLYVIPQVNIQEILDGDPKVKAKVMTCFSKIYNEYMVNLFKAYRSNFGFFDLSQAYQDSE